MADDSQAFQVCELRLTDCQSVGVRSAGSGVDGGSRHGMLKHMFCRGSGKPGLSQTGESKEEAMELCPPQSELERPPYVVTSRTRGGLFWSHLIIWSKKVFGVKENIV